jgi:hypothetical protein
VPLGRLLYGYQAVAVWALQRLGLSRLLARRFADNVDWHDVAALVERGCPPELALRIVR